MLLAWCFLSLFLERDFNAALTSQLKRDFNSVHGIGVQAYVFHTIMKLVH